MPNQTIKAIRKSSSSMEVKSTSEHWRAPKRTSDHHELQAKKKRKKLWKENLLVNILKFTEGIFSKQR